jgi:hypothetical protein
MERETEDLERKERLFGIKRRRYILQNILGERKSQETY